MGYGTLAWSVTAYHGLYLLLTSQSVVGCHAQGQDDSVQQHWHADMCIVQIAVLVLEAWRFAKLTWVQ